MTSEEWQNSPMVRRSIEEAEFLRERLRKTALTITESGGDREQIIDYFHTLYALVEKEELLYTRMTLTDDRDVKLALQVLQQSLDDYPEIREDVTLPEIFKEVKEEIISTLKKLDPNFDDIPPYDDPLA